MKTASATGNRGGDHRGFTRAAAKKRFSWVLTFCPSWSAGSAALSILSCGMSWWKQLKPTHPKAAGKHLCPILPNPHLFVPPLCRSDPWLCAATNSWCAALLTSPAANISIPYQRHNRESILRGHEGIEYARFQRTSLSQSQSRGCCVPPFLEPLISVDHWKGAQKVPKRCPGRAWLQVGVDVAPCSRHSPPIRKWLVSSLRSAGPSNDGRPLWEI